MPPSRLFVFSNKQNSSSNYFICYSMHIAQGLCLDSNTLPPLQACCAIHQTTPALLTLIYFIKRFYLTLKFDSTQYEYCLYSSGSTKNVTSYFMAQLPPQLFYDLVQLYMIDFELFGFNLPEYADFASHRTSLSPSNPLPTRGLKSGQLESSD